MKLPILSGEKVCKILKKFGFEEIRRKGSHIVMQKKIERGTITVIVPNHKEIKKGTLKSIIRQSKIPPEKFFRG